MLPPPLLLLLYPHLRDSAVHERGTEVLDVGIRDLALRSDLHRGDAAHRQVLRRGAHPAPGDLVARVEHVERLGALCGRRRGEDGFEDRGRGDRDGLQL